MSKFKTLCVLLFCFFGLTAFQCDAKPDDRTIHVSRRNSTGGPTFNANLMRSYWLLWSTPGAVVDFDDNEIVDIPWPPTSPVWIATVSNAYMTSKGCALTEKTCIKKPTDGSELEILVRDSWWESNITASDRKMQMHHTIGLALGLQPFSSPSNLQSVMQRPPTYNQPQAREREAFLHCRDLGYISGCQLPGFPWSPW